MDKSKAYPKDKKAAKGFDFDREQFFEHDNDIDPLYDPVEFRRHENG